MIRFVTWPARKARRQLRKLRIAAQRASARNGFVGGVGRSHLAKVVDWSGLGITAGNYVDLATFTLHEKRSTVRYFVDEQDLDWFRNANPFASHENAIEEADEVLAGRIRLAGLGSVQLESPVRWTIDPLTQERIWHSSMSLRPRRDIDTRFWIELNLHRHFAVVARAGLITGEAKYADYMQIQWNHWLRDNPPIDEEYISDGLELSLRAFMWTHCLYVADRSTWREQDVLRMLALIARYGEMIERQCAQNTNRNNHLAAEAFGLFFIGLLYPEFKNASRWRDTGLTVLGEVADEQFSAGGVHKEEALGYQLFVTELLLTATLLADRNQLTIPAVIRERLARCAEYLFMLVRPDGSMPDYGDEGMPLFSPTGRTTIEPMRVLALLEAVSGFQAPLISRPAWVQEETFWFTGRTVSEFPTATGHQVGPRILARQFDGHVVLRTESAHVHFDCSVHGMGKRAGHGHDDALNIDYFAAEVPWLADAGTFSYARGESRRAYFANACAHSSLLVNGHGAGVQVKTGSFGWLQKADAQMIAIGEEDGFVWSRGRHLGVSAAGQDRFPEIDRYVILTSDGALLIVDSGTLREDGAIDSLWHMHPYAELEAQSDTPRFHAGGHTLRIFSHCSAPQSISLHRGSDVEQPGWHSPAYGVVVPTWVVRARATVSGPFWRATLLVTNADSEIDFPLAVSESSPDTLICKLDSPVNPAIALKIDRTASPMSSVERLH